MSSWSETYARLQQPKLTRRVLVKAESKKAEAKYLREQQGIARRRDRNRCRICGADGYIEVDHVERRSAFGSKRIEHKHHHSNLWCLCAGPRPNGLSCHDKKGKSIFKVAATTDRGTNGPVEVLRLDPKEGGFVLFRKRA